MRIWWPVLSEHVQVRRLLLLVAAPSQKSRAAGAHEWRRTAACFRDFFGRPRFTLFWTPNEMFFGRCPTPETASVCVPRRHKSRTSEPEMPRRTGRRSTRRVWRSAASGLGWPVRATSITHERAEADGARRRFHDEIKKYYLGQESGMTDGIRSQRMLRWTKDGVTNEAEQRHAEIVIKDMNMKKPNAVHTPAGPVPCGEQISGEAALT